MRPKIPTNKLNSACDLHNYARGQTFYCACAAWAIFLDCQSVIRCQIGGLARWINAQSLAEWICRRYILSSMQVIATLLLHSFIHSYSFINTCNLLQCSERKTDFNVVLRKINQVEWTLQTLFASIYVVTTPGKCFRYINQSINQEQSLMKDWQNVTS